MHSFVCLACGKGFKYEHSLNFHIKSYHGSDGSNGVNSSLSPCTSVVTSPASSSSQQQGSSASSSTTAATLTTSALPNSAAVAAALAAAVSAVTTGSPVNTSPLGTGNIPNITIPGAGHSNVSTVACNGGDVDTNVVNSATSNFVKVVASLLSSSNHHHHHHSASSSPATVASVVPSLHNGNGIATSINSAVALSPFFQHALPSLVGDTCSSASGASFTNNSVTAALAAVAAARDDYLRKCLPEIAATSSSNSNNNNNSINSNSNPTASSTSTTPTPATANGFICSSGKFNCNVTSPSRVVMSSVDAAVDACPLTSTVLSCTSGSSVDALSSPSNATITAKTSSICSGGGGGREKSTTTTTTNTSSNNTCNMAIGEAVSRSSSPMSVSNEMSACGYVHSPCASVIPTPTTLDSNSTVTATNKPSNNCSHSDDNDDASGKKKVQGEDESNSSGSSKNIGKCDASTASAMVTESKHESSNASSSRTAASRSNNSIDSPDEKTLLSSTSTSSSTIGSSSTTTTTTTTAAASTTGTGDGGYSDTNTGTVRAMESGTSCTLANAEQRDTNASHELSHVFSYGNVTRRPSHQQQEQEKPPPNTCNVQPQFCPGSSSRVHSPPLATNDDTHRVTVVDEDTSNSNSNPSHCNSMSDPISNDSTDHQLNCNRVTTPSKLHSSSPPTSASSSKPNQNSATAIATDDDDDDDVDVDDGDEDETSTTELTASAQCTTSTQVTKSHVPLTFVNEVTSHYSCSVTPSSSPSQTLNQAPITATTTTNISTNNSNTTTTTLTTTSSAKSNEPTVSPLTSSSSAFQSGTSSGLTIRGEKPLISLLEGYQCTNDQLYLLYKCCQCGLAFPSFPLVSSHITSVHTGSHSIELSDNVSLSTSNCCKLCGAIFKWRSQLNLHESLHKTFESHLFHHQQQQLLQGISNENNNNNSNHGTNGNGNHHSLNCNSNDSSESIKFGKNGYSAADVDKLSSLAANFPTINPLQFHPGVLPIINSYLASGKNNQKIQQGTSATGSSSTTTSPTVSPVQPLLIPPMVSTSSSTAIPLLMTSNDKGVSDADQNSNRDAGYLSEGRGGSSSKVANSTNGCNPPGADCMSIIKSSNDQSFPSSVGTCNSVTATTTSSSRSSHCKDPSSGHATSCNSTSTLTSSSIATQLHNSLALNCSSSTPPLSVTQSSSSPSSSTSCASSSSCSIVPSNVASSSNSGTNVTAAAMAAAAAAASAGLLMPSFLPPNLVLFNPFFNPSAAAAVQAAFDAVNVATSTNVVAVSPTLLASTAAAASAKSSNNCTSSSTLQHPSSNLLAASGTAGVLASTTRPSSVGASGNTCNGNNNSSTNGNVLALPSASLAGDKLLTNNNSLAESNEHSTINGPPNGTFKRKDYNSTSSSSNVTATSKASYKSTSNCTSALSSSSLNTHHLNDVNGPENQILNLSKNTNSPCNSSLSLDLSCGANGRLSHYNSQLPPAHRSLQMSKSINPGSSSSVSSNSSSTSSPSLAASSLEAHLADVSKVPPPTPPPELGEIEETAPGQFKCRYCDKTFDRIFSVHRHERVHTGYKPCVCKVCGRGFSEKRNLRHHIIRFHSDGSGRELLKRARKDKSISITAKSFASVLKQQSDSMVASLAAGAAGANGSGSKNKGSTNWSSFAGPQSGASDPSSIDSVAFAGLANSINASPVSTPNGLPGHPITPFNWDAATLAAVAAAAGVNLPGVNSNCHFFDEKLQGKTKSSLNHSSSKSPSMSDLTASHLAKKLKMEASSANENSSTATGSRERNSRYLSSPSPTGTSSHGQKSHHQPSTKRDLPVNLSSNLTSNSELINTESKSSSASSADCQVYSLHQIKYSRQVTDVFKSKTGHKLPTAACNPKNNLRSINFDGVNMTLNSVSDHKDYLAHNILMNASNGYAKDLADLNEEDETEEDTAVANLRRFRRCNPATGETVDKENDKFKSKPTPLAKPVVSSDGNNNIDYCEGGERVNSSSSSGSSRRRKSKPCRKIIVQQASSENSMGECDDESCPAIAVHCDVNVNCEQGDFDCSNGVDCNGQINEQSGINNGLPGSNDSAEDNCTSHVHRDDGDDDDCHDTHTHTHDSSTQMTSGTRNREVFCKRKRASTMLNSLTNEVSETKKVKATHVNVNSANSVAATPATTTTTTAASFCGQANLSSDADVANDGDVNSKFAKAKKKGSVTSPCKVSKLSNDEDDDGNNEYLMMLMTSQNSTKGNDSRNCTIYTMSRGKSSSGSGNTRDHLSHHVNHEIEPEDGCYNNGNSNCINNNSNNSNITISNLTNDESSKLQAQAKEKAKATDTSTTTKSEPSQSDHADGFIDHINGYAQSEFKFASGQVFKKKTKREMKTPAIFNLLDSIEKSKLKQQDEVIKARKSQNSSFNSSLDSTEIAKDKEFKLLKLATERLRTVFRSADEMDSHLDCNIDSLDENILASNRTAAAANVCREEEEHEHQQEQEQEEEEEEQLHDEDDEDEEVKSTVSGRITGASTASLVDEEETAERQSSKSFSLSLALEKNHFNGNRKNVCNSASSDSNNQLNEELPDSINGSEDEKNLMSSDESSMDEAMVVDCDEDEAEEANVKSTRRSRRRRMRRHKLRCDFGQLTNEESGECNNASSNSSSSNVASNCSSTPLNSPFATSTTTCNSNGNNASRLRNHGAFFSSYSPRLGIVDKPIKRNEACRPLLGPDGKYLYPCGYCSKNFCSLSDLNRHMNFHEDVRPFKCQFCDYQSRTNSQLKVHMMRHAGIKQYLCQTCNYNGVTQSDLNRHCKTRCHILRSTNACSICSLGFSTRTLLDEHLIKCHTDVTSAKEPCNSDQASISNSPPSTGQETSLLPSSQVPLSNVSSLVASSS